jgi:glucose-6-phosphate isomerase
MAEYQATRIQRHLSDMWGCFFNQAAYEALLAQANPVVYEMYEMWVAETNADLTYGLGVIYPGKVGNELFMTRGFRRDQHEAARLFTGLRGEGVVIAQPLTGPATVEWVREGHVVYVPPGIPHRIVNTSPDAVLVVSYTYAGPAVRHSLTKEAIIFQKLVMDHDGRVGIIDNPRWMETAKGPRRQRTAVRP